MTRLLIPVLLALLTGWLGLRLSAARSRRQLEATARPLSDPALERMMAPLARALGVDRIALRLLPDPGVNAMADAEGRICLTQGFLDRRNQGAVSDAELASVVAHELGHVAQGHARRRRIDETGRTVVLTAASSALQRILPYAGPWAARQAGTAVLARMSRRDEFQADAWASALLIKAGIGTGPQKSLLAKLETMRKEGGDSPPDWAQGHPQSAERIAAIAANEARWLD